MKKILPLLALLISNISLADTTGTLLLQGEIPEELSIVVNPAAGVHDDLDLTTGASDLEVATVDESSNADSGYKISINSVNDGSLVNGSFSVSYALKYDGSPVTLSTVDQTAKTVATSGVYSDTSSVEITFAAQDAATLLEGLYSDTLTFTISAN